MLCFLTHVTNNSFEVLYRLGKLGTKYDNLPIVIYQMSYIIYKVIYQISEATMCLTKISPESWTNPVY